MKKRRDLTYGYFYDAVLQDKSLSPIEKLVLTKCIHIWRMTHKLNFSKETMAEWVGASRITVLRALHSMSDNKEFNDECRYGFFHIVVCGGQAKKQASTYLINEERINEYFGVEIFPTKPPIYSTASPTVTNNETKAMCAAEENEQQTIQIKKFNKVDRTKIHNDRQDSKQDRAIERESGTSIR